MRSLVVVAGARPNFVKIAPILRALESRGNSLPCTLVHTGQHYDSGMSDVFFAQLGIREPDVHLKVGSGPHGAQTARIMIRFEEYLTALSDAPLGVVVVGDVNSTLACALVAAKLCIPVAHVEAGLRSFDRSMPEEINRILTDAIADVLLVSEPAGLANLEREGIPAEKIRYVGNVMIDSLVHQLPAARDLETATSLGLGQGQFGLVTIHRPSNVDDGERLSAVVDFLRWLGRQLPTVFPMHPRFERSLADHGLRESLEGASGLRLLAPLAYREFLGLTSSARLVVTDSGGVQEETTYLGIPCITLRTTTERPVTLTSGTNVLVGEDLDRARAAVLEALRGGARSRDPIEGWDGRAAERVVDALIGAWGSR